MPEELPPHPTWSLASFGLSDVTRLGAALRPLGSDAQTMEEVAGDIVHCLRNGFIDDRTGSPAMALVRFYKTHPFGALDDDLRAFVRGMLAGAPPSPDMQCLTLLASAGERPEWNSRKTSVGHRAIPLPSEQFVEQSPMIAHLIRQFGLDVASLLEPDPRLLMDADQHSHNVFYVPEAVGSPMIPAQQDFVVPFGIRSVIGVGGLLPAGELFALILFSRTHIARETAALFGPLSLSVKVAVLPVCQPESTFRAAGLVAPRHPGPDALATYRSRIAGLEQLLEAHERMVVEQSTIIERTNRELAHLASTDGLTGVPNRREFEKRSDAEHKRAARSETSLGVVMIDIDLFKSYNDRLGHVAGDECLKAVAEALVGCMNRSSDFLARYGGEEFAMILPETDRSGVAHLAEAMRAVVEALALPHPASQVSDVVTISVGATVARPSRDSAVATLINAADAALYRAKTAGRNRSVVA
jgi:diguanylate cyclase (GGDEF)-like protein